jgi:hypothetical protein
MPNAAVKFYNAPGMTHATYACGYPPGDVTKKGECPACHKTVTVTLSGDLYKHKCISQESIEGDTGRLQPLPDTIRPVPTDSVIIWGIGWRIIYENKKFSEAWIALSGVWQQVGATEAARLIVI